MKQIIHTDKAPGAIGPYSQGISFGDLVITSGQIGRDPATGVAPEGICAQTEQCLKNVKAILEEAGLTMDNVVKATVFLDNIDDFSEMNRVYATFFTEGSFPCRSAFEVARLPGGALVEIEVIATR